MAGKLYGDAEQYERKLERVIERFKATDFDFDWNRKGTCWIKFKIDNEPFYFPYSVEQAREGGSKIAHASDAFALIVLTLEDLARANERGTFSLKKVLAAVAMLEPPKEIPSWCRELEFDQIPADAKEVNERFRKLSQVRHPDNGGSDQAFKDLTKAKDEAKQYFEGK